MQLLSYLLLSLSFLISSTSFAAVSVDIDDGVVLIAVNGKAVASVDTVDKQKNIQMRDGVNQLLVEYSAEIEESNNNFYTENTRAYVILFESFDENLLLNAPTLKNSYDFSAFRENPTWVLTEKNGKIKDIKVAELVKEGFQLNRSYEKELVDFNMTNSPAAFVLRDDLSINNYENKTDMAEKMLRYWYVNSTLETKAAFLKWIGK